MDRIHKATLYFITILLEIIIVYAWKKEGGG